MEQTNNYGLKIYEGSDIFNPLIVENDNANILDSTIKTVSDKTIGHAVDLKSGNIHAISRTDTSNQFFEFVATEDFNIGDEFTVDGTSVTAKMPNGTGLTDRAFVVNSMVLCSLNGTLLTIYTNGASEAQNALKLEGHSASYFATADDLTETGMRVESVEASYNDYVAPTLSEVVNNQSNFINRYVDIDDNNVTFASSTCISGSHVTLGRGMYLVQLSIEAPRSRNYVAGVNITSQVPTTEGVANTRCRCIKDWTSSITGTQNFTQVYTFTLYLGTASDMKAWVWNKSSSWTGRINVRYIKLGTTEALPIG